MTKKRKRIIVVDDNNTNLIACKKILKPLYEVYSVPSAKKMFKVMERVTPDLILLDVEMPDMNGYEAARKLKSSGDHSSIPVIFLSVRNDPVSQKFGLHLGARDYINKPFTAPELLERIGNHLAAHNNAAHNNAAREGENQTQECV